MTTVAISQSVNFECLLFSLTAECCLALIGAAASQNQRTRAFRVVLICRALNLHNSCVPHSEWVEYWVDVGVVERARHVAGVLGMSLANCLQIRRGLVVLTRVSTSSVCVVY